MRAAAADPRGTPSNDVITTVVSTLVTTTAVVTSQLKDGCAIGPGTVGDPLGCGSVVDAWSIGPLARIDANLADTTAARSDDGMLSNAVRLKKTANTRSKSDATP